MHGAHIGNFTSLVLPILLPVMGLRIMCLRRTPSCWKRTVFVAGVRAIVGPVAGLHDAKVPNGILVGNFRFLVVIVVDDIVIVVIVAFLDGLKLIGMEIGP